VAENRKKIRVKRRERIVEWKRKRRLERSRCRGSSERDGNLARDFGQQL